MSSSSNYRPSQLHHVNLHSSGKRPFEECGYDSDSDTNLNSALQPSGSGSSASSSRFSSSPSSSSSSSGEGRNKRARSNSTSSHSSSSDASRSTGYDTAQSSAHSDLSLDGPSILPRAAVDCPIRPSTAFVSQEEQQDMSDLVVDRHRQLSPPPRTPLSTSAEQQLRASLERFNEFDRQMAALRTSLAASRSSPVLPPVASSAREGTHSPRDDWAPMSSSFLSMSSNGRPASGSSDAQSADATVAPSETLHSLSTFGSSDGSSTDAGSPSTSSAGGVSLAAMYGNLPRYPPYSPYRPPSGFSPSATLDHSGDSTQTVDDVPPPYIGTPNSEDGPQLASRSSQSSRWSPELLSPPEPVRSSPSPLVLDAEMLTTTTDDSLVPRYETVTESSRSPRGWLGRNGPDGGVSRGNSFQPVSSDAVDQRSTHATPSRPRSSDAMLRVFGRRYVEPAPSVFDVFGIGDSAHDRHLHRQGRSPVRDQPTFQTRASGRLASTADPSTSPARAPGPESRDESARVQGYQTARPDFHSRLYSGSTWSTLPSSNSLVSESAAEQRRVRAREQFRGRRRLSSFENDDEEEQTLEMPHEPAEQPSRWDASYPGLRMFFLDALPSGQREDSMNRTDRLSSHPSPAPRRPSDFESFFEILEEADSSVQAGRDESHLEESSHSSAPSSAAREQSPLRPPSQRPHLQTDGSSTSSGPYSYNNLNLASFRSGMFRDSLRRNAESDRIPNQTSAPVISRASGLRPMSEVIVEDNGSTMDIDDEMILDDLIASLGGRERRPSNTTQDSQPRSRGPLSLHLRPGFSVLSRPSEHAEPSERYQYPVDRGTSIRNNHSEGGRSHSSRFFETLQRQREDGARRSSIGGGSSNPTRSSSNAFLQTERYSGDLDSDIEGRRTLGGSIRSRWARFAGLSSSSSASASGGDGPSSMVAIPRAQRVQPHPVGARPQVVEHRRASSVSMLTDIDEPRTFNRPERRVVNPSVEPSPRRDFPWRPFVSNPRSSFAPTSHWGSSAIQEQERVEPPIEDQPSRLRSLRQRFQLDRADGPRASRPGMLRAMMSRRNFGDYVPDELFDSSYEALLSLSSTIGEVRSKATPDEVIASLPTGTFQEWAKEDSETRCPICLDDYEPQDAVTKMLECPHWLHKTCLEQWLKTANTCPVCRKKVKASPAPARRLCPYHRDYADPMSGSSSAGSTANIHTPPPYPGSSQNHFLGTSESSIQPTRRFVRPVIPPTSAHLHGPHRLEHHIALAERQRELHGHPVPHPVHSHFHVRPLHHVHPHAHHFHPTPGSQTSSFHAPPVVPPAFPRSRTHGQVPDAGRAPGDLGVQRPSLTTSNGSASEQLIVPRAPTAEGPDQTSRSASAMDRHLFTDIYGRTTRPAAAGSTSMVDGTRGSFTIPPSSSVTFSGPSNGGPTSTSTSSTRDDTPTFVITNSSGNPVLVTNRVSNGHGHAFTTSLDVEPAHPSQHPASSVRPGPHGTFAWGPGARGRAHPGPDSRENADPTSGNTEPWWLA